MSAHLCSNLACSDSLQDLKDKKNLRILHLILQVNQKFQRNFQSSKDQVLLLLKQSQEPTHPLIQIFQIYFSSQTLRQAKFLLLQTNHHTLTGYSQYLTFKLIFFTFSYQKFNLSTGAVQYLGLNPKSSVLNLQSRLSHRFRSNKRSRVRIFQDVEFNQQSVGVQLLFQGPFAYMKSFIRILFAFLPIFGLSF